MRINLKELIEELKKINNGLDYKFEPNFNENERTTFKKVFEVDASLLEKTINELKQLENIYNQ